MEFRDKTPWKFSTSTFLIRLEIQWFPPLFIRLEILTDPSMGWTVHHPRNLPKFIPSETGKPRLAFFRVHVAGWWKAWNLHTDKRPLFQRNNWAKKWVLEAFKVRNEKLDHQKVRVVLRTWSTSGTCQKTPGSWVAWWLRNMEDHGCFECRKNNLTFCWRLQCGRPLLEQYLQVLHSDTKKQGWNSTINDWTHQQQTSTQHVCFWGNKITSAFTDVVDL